MDADRNTSDVTSIAALVILSGRMTAHSSRGALALLVVISIGCGSGTLPPPPSASPTPGSAAIRPSTGACGGLELNPTNRHYFREVASGQPVLIVGYRNLTPEFSESVPAAPSGQPPPTGAGARDPRFTDYVIDDVTGQAGPFNFPNLKRHYVTVVHLGAGDDPAVDPLYDNGNGSRASPSFFAWPWLRSPGAAGACYGSFGDPKGAPYDVGGKDTCPAAWNNPYFDRLSAAVSRASSACITSEIKVFDKSAMQNHWRDVPWASDNSSNSIELPSCTQTESWVQSFYLQQPAPHLQLSQQCYVDKVLDATKASVNVVYEVENENNAVDSEPWARTWAQRIKERTSRLVSYSSIQDDNVAAALQDPSIDILNLHFGVQLEDERTLPRDFITDSWNVGVSSINGAVGSGKPVNVDEFGKCHDNGNVPTYDMLRKMAWAIIASGGHFHIEDTCDPLTTPPGEAPVSVDAKPREIIENIRRFVEDSGLPDGAWNFSMSQPFPAPPASGGPTPTQVRGRFCMGPDAAIFQTSHIAAPRDYLCYYDGSDGAASKRIDGIEGPAAYTAMWWDPRNGGFTGPSIPVDCVTDHTATVSAPDAGDWVLLLRKLKDC
jgi:hypothetical protein